MRYAQFFIYLFYCFNDDDLSFSSLLKRVLFEKLLLQSEQNSSNIDNNFQLEFNYKNIFCKNNYVYENDIF